MLLRNRLIDCMSFSHLVHHSALDTDIESLFLVKCAHQPLLSCLSQVGYKEMPVVIL